MTLTPLQRIKTIILPLLACGLLSSCASLIGPRQLELPLARLQQGLEQRFPLNNRVMSLLDLQLSRPHLTLLPDTNRVALRLEASIAPPFIKQSWRGDLTLSGHLVVDAARNAVFLREASIDRLTLDGVDDAGRRQFAKAASLVADQIIRDLPLYSFRPEDLRYAGVQFIPTGIVARPGALVVNFEPVK